MQNDDNSNIKPKRRRRAGARTKKKFWSNIGNPPQPKPQPVAVNAKGPPILNKQNQPAIYQTPDQHLESVVDLTDDNAPNNPMIDAAESIKKFQPKQEDQITKQEPVKIINFLNFGNKLINPGLKSRFNQEEDFTQDIDDIDFTDNISGPSYNNQFVIKKPDISIDINKSTKQNPTSKPPVTIPITLKKEVNTPVKKIPFPSVNRKFIAANKTATSTNNPVTPENKAGTSKGKQIKKLAGKEVVRNFIVVNNADSAATVTPVKNKKGTIQVLNRTFQAFVPKTPEMELKNNASNVVPPQATNINNGNAFYKSMPTYSFPKGIPRSFLQPRPETIVNSQENPQINTPITNTMPNWGAPQTPQYPQQFATNPQGMIYNNYNMPFDNNAPTFNATDSNAPMFVQTENLTDKPQQYSPSETYADLENNDDQEIREGSESPDLLQGQKRLSAFKRLGPQTRSKKPKLTINLMFNKEQAVREVVDETDEKPEVYKPVHLREDIISSKDDTVVKYLPLWPWRKNVSVKKHVSFRQSKSVMLLELEQMQEEVYDKDNMYVQITIKGYPPTWKKDRVLDIMLESVRGRSFIPIFIEFNETECKFFVIRCRAALMAIHKYGFVIRHDDVELSVTISQIDLTVKHIDFIPRLVLRKRLSMGYDGERKLNLSAFTLGNDIIHFLYYPLHRLSNQLELVELQSTVAWDYLTDLDLSHNKLTTLQGFEFPKNMPKLKHLNLSHNYLEKATLLLVCRGIPLNSIWLEGNPLCHDYIDPNHYVKVLKMMFPSIMEIDGTPLQIADKLPSIKRNYCPEDATGLVNKFLEVFFPLLDSGFEHRNTIQELYEEDAIMTITYKFKLRYGQVYRYYRNLFLRCRVIDEGEMESIEGSSAISKLISKWPGLKHDPYTFTVDVMYHDENTAILRVGGIVKLTAETLAEDEHLLAFTRTLVLHSHDGEEYKIKNEMVYWDEPTDEYAATAFQVTAIKTKPLSLKLESIPDDDLKEKLLVIFMQLTELEKAPSVRCLEMKEWNLKNALEYFTKLLKLDSIESI